MDLVFDYWWGRSQAILGSRSPFGRPVEFVVRRSGFQPRTVVIDPRAVARRDAVLEIDLGTVSLSS